MTIIPLDDRILVRSSTHATDVRTDDLIPDPRTAPRQQGVVIAVGAGTLTGDGPPVPLAIKAGDTVVFDGHIGDHIMVGDAACVIMKATDARRVEDVSAATSRRRDEFHRPLQGADHPGTHQTWHGPHQIVVWSE